jgi:adenylylsulfate kinase-like enzyme
LRGAGFEMRLIFLYGLPGAGKLTVARELGSLTGWNIFHNHLTVDLLLSVFSFGSPEFVELRQQIWLSVIDAAAATDTEGLIFTFNPENSVRQGFVDAVQTVIAKHRGTIDFVEIFCEEAVLEVRLDTPNRRQMKKLLSVELFRELRGQGVFDSPQMPRPQLRVDTTHQSPQESAAQILKELELPSVARPGG